MGERWISSQEGLWGLGGNCSWEEDLDPSLSSLDQEENGPENIGDGGDLGSKAANIT